MTELYVWAGGAEAMLRTGPREVPTLLILGPLFEEANRMRRIVVATMRRLADDFGVASALPDLPGTGDSPIATVDARHADWEQAIGSVAALLPPPVLTVSIRGGALLDEAANPDHRWRLSPESGARLLRDMARSTAVSGGLKAGEVEARARAEPTMLAGNLIHPALFADLADRVPSAGTNVRTVRLDGDPGTADRHLSAQPPWRRAEPGDDPTLVSAMVDDILSWMRQCGVR